MSEQEFRRALGYANSAMDLLKRGQIPPYPQFYELLYTYATGVNPSLNQRVNQIFREGTATAELAERLYNEFLKSQDANERISSVSERMSIWTAYSFVCCGCSGRTRTIPGATRAICTSRVLTSWLPSWSLRMTASVGT